MFYSHEWRGRFLIMVQLCCGVYWLLRCVVEFELQRCCNRLCWLHTFHLFHFLRQYLQINLLKFIYNHCDHHYLTISISCLLSNSNGWVQKLQYHTKIKTKFLMHVVILHQNKNKELGIYYLLLGFMNFFKCSLCILFL